MDFSDILPEEVETAMKSAAIISMGTEIADEDVLNIALLCDQVIQLSEYRVQLYDYLKNRMAAIAPNLTAMVGELVGARLISHAGSLLNLAKHPASTVQILGAEKALFRALKTKRETPKYGLIYHASVVGQSAPKNKGKISRVLAAKTALAVRVDALGDCTEATIGLENRERVEARLHQLEHGGAMRSLSQRGTPGKLAAQPKAYTPDASAKNETYNTATDVVMAPVEDAPTLSEKELKKKAKKEKKRKAAEDANGEKEEKKKKKKSKKSKE